MPDRTDGRGKGRGERDLREGAQQQRGDTGTG
jgi:hypothetical protein